MNGLNLKTITLWMAVAFFSFLLHLSTSSALAFPVPPLPEDNLLVNPWFRSAGDPTRFGFDGWTNPLQDGVGWGGSQKESNPSPDIVVSGVCGRKSVYCGTSIRWAENFGKVYPGMDVYLYQVVSANSSHRELKFFTYWASHRVDVAEVTIYGGNSPEGPWTKVWVPFFITVEQSPKPPKGGDKSDLWFNTGFLEATIVKGYPYYKVEIHARNPEPLTQAGKRDVGVKITGVYFATEYTDGPVTSSPVVDFSPFIDPTPSSHRAPPESQLRSSSARERTREPEPSPTLTPLIQPSLAKSQASKPTRTQTPPAQAASPTEGKGAGVGEEQIIRLGENDLMVGTMIGMLIIGLTGILYFAFGVGRKRDNSRL